MVVRMNFDDLVYRTTCCSLSPLFHSGLMQYAFIQNFELQPSLVLCLYQVRVLVIASAEHDVIGPDRRPILIPILVIQAHGDDYADFAGAVNFLNSTTMSTVEVLLRASMLPHSSGSSHWTRTHLG